MSEFWDVSHGFFFRKMRRVVRKVVVVLWLGLPGKEVKDNAPFLGFISLISLARRCQIGLKVYLINWEKWTRAECLCAYN